MKVVYVDVNYLVNIKFPKEFIDDLPETIGLFTTAQYLNQLDHMKTQLEDAGKHVKLFKAKHTEVPGQILGCNIQEFTGVQAILYVGDGSFHPKALAMKNDIPIFSYNPLSKKYEHITVKPRTGLIQAFNTAKSIGVLITTKPGQQKIEQALELGKRFPQKNFYFLIANEINNLENFPFIDFYVNTACPRIATDDLDKPSMNLEELPA
ncbi:MAG: 2-(3-amino-3-carboxypropyl)histidine synthase subunit [Nanoarchaeota archaeon]|nr:2-(3-amino-3-carboxypropyl)histidine synthase subunit [Nanoarchaeota archaeon]